MLYLEQEPTHEVPWLAPVLKIFSALNMISLISNISNNFLLYNRPWRLLLCLLGEDERKEDQRKEDQRKEDQRKEDQRKEDQRKEDQRKGDQRKGVQIKEDQKEFFFIWFISKSGT